MNPGFGTGCTMTVTRSKQLLIRRITKRKRIINVVSLTMWRNFVVYGWIFGQLLSLNFHSFHISLAWATLEVCTSHRVSVTQHSLTVWPMVRSRMPDMVFQFIPVKRTVEWNPALRWRSEVPLVTDYGNDKGRVMWIQQLVDSYCPLIAKARGRHVKEKQRSQAMWESAVGWCIDLDKVQLWTQHLWQAYQCYFWNHFCD